MQDSNPSKCNAGEHCPLRLDAAEPSFLQRKNVNRILSLGPKTQNPLLWVLGFCYSPRSTAPLFSQPVVEIRETGPSTNGLLTLPAPQATIV
jgi:hypothetical protein